MRHFVKNINGALLIAVLVVSSAAFSFAQAPSSAASQVSEFDVNGLKVLVKRRPGTPTVAAGLFIRGGVRNYSAANAGIENFMLAAASEASKSFPREKLRKETSRVGTVISGAANYDYSVLSMASTKQNFDISWQMFTDVALNPAFMPEDVERIRDAILTGLRAQTDSPEGVLEDASNRVVFAGHPYAIDPQGTADTIAKIKAADLAAYHKKVMTTSQLLLVIVGDVEPAAVQKRVAASFASVPRGSYKDEQLAAFSFAKPSLDVNQKPVQTDYVKGTFTAPSISSPDYYAMRTAISILQQAVFQEVRGRRNLSYAPDASMDERAANTGSISVSSTNPNEAVAVMLEEIRKLQRDPVDEDTIGQMAGFFLTTYYMKQETNAAQAAELAQYELLGGGWRNSLEFLERMRRVKPADIQAVANKYMKNLQFVIVGNAKGVDRTVYLQAL